MVDLKDIKKGKDTWLSGMGEITDFVNRSAPTLLKWKKERNFPMEKINGVWESDTELILEWRKSQFGEV